MYTFRRTTLLSAGLSAFLVGLACGHRWYIFPSVGVVAAGVSLLLTARRKNVLTLLACFALGLSTGWWRGGVFRKQLLPYESLYGRQVTVLVTATSDGVYGQTKGLGFDAGQVQVLSPSSMKLPGVLKIEALGITAVYRHDRLQVTGKLYPSGGARQGSIKFAQARLLERHINWLEQIRLNFNASMQSVLPEPQASFGLGILVGQRSTLPKAINDQLSVIGLTHIIAVSGYNLTIIISFLGKRLGRSKYQTLVLSTSLIVVFVLITGFSASIVRAAIVSMLSIGAWYYGRTFKPLLILLLSGALTAGWYPIYIWSDIGWYLSFFAFFGVLVLAPLISKFFWRDREPRGLAPLIIETASAQIMAGPIIMYIFKTTSLIALPANLIVVPLVPLAMLLAVAAGLTGMISLVIGAWAAWPAKVLLLYMLSIVDVLSRVPHASLQQALSWQLMVIFYGLVILACVGLWLKTKPSYGKITDENRS